MTATLLREELIEYSTLQCITEGLAPYGFVTIGQEDAITSEANVRVREAFPAEQERAEELEITTIAFGFNIDDGGQEVELGSTLTEYRHTLEVWTFALEPRFGRRLAHAIRHVARHAQNIPLLDFNEEGNPQIDTCQVLKAQVQHQGNASPRPWDRFVWTTSIVVQDYMTP